MTGRRLTLATAVLLLALSSCSENHQPPPPMTFDSLPITGSLADAGRAGFTRCIPDNVSMRCRREGVTFAGLGPFSAAVDLEGGGGAGGFDHLTLWNQNDQSALVAVTDKLRTQGWSECLTPEGKHWDGQAIYQRQGSPIFVALDLSYWSARRLTVYPASRTAIPHCRT